MCGHLWPVLGPGAVEAFGDGLAAVEEDVADEVCDRAVEDVEALAMLSPSARVAPSTAAPAAVPMSGLLILTRFSFRECLPWPRRPGSGSGDPPSPVRQAGLTGGCALLLNPR